jgi:hypothetical protein
VYMWAGDGPAVLDMLEEAYQQGRRAAQNEEAI